MLTELIARDPDTAALRLLVPLLRGLTRRGRTVILLAPPDSIGVPALAGFGIDLNRLSIVPARNAADRLWAVERALRAPGFGTLLAWLPQDRCRPEHLRRLQAAAQTAPGPVFLFRELPAQFQPSPAPLRLLLLARPQQQLSVQVLKRRGPVLVRPNVLDLPKPMVAIRLSSPGAHGPAPHPVRGQPIRILPLSAQAPCGAIRSTASVITPSRPPARNSAARSGSLIV
jgi:protein ImuA